MSQHGNSHIFTLARQFEIPLEAGRQVEFTDETLEQFRNKYHQWSQERDREVFAHLTVNPSLFRSLLPNSPRTWWLAAQIVWYFDQLIVRDPVFLAIVDRNRDSEDTKIALREAVQLLWQFRNSIESGYLMLYGASLVPDLSSEPSEEIRRLVQIPEVSAALRDAAYCGYIERPDSMGNRAGLYQVVLDAGGILGCSYRGGLTIGPGQTLNTPEITVGEVFPPVTSEELNKLIGGDPFERMEAAFSREVHSRLTAIEAARRVNAAVLFDRKVDGVIASAAPAHWNPAKQQATSEVLNIALPYLEGVSPERLPQLREHLPTAFSDFRSQLLAIVQGSKKEGCESIEELRARVEKSILPSLRSLDREMAAEAKRARLLGYGGSVVSALGALAGSFMAMEATHLLTTLGVGVGAGIKAAADFKLNFKHIRFTSCGGQDPTPRDKQRITRESCPRSDP